MRIRKKDAIGHAPGLAGAVLDIGAHATVRFVQADALSDITENPKRARRASGRDSGFAGILHSANPDRPITNRSRTTKQKQNESKHREPDIAKRNTLSSRSRKNG